MFPAELYKHEADISSNEHSKHTQKVCVGGTVRVYRWIPWPVALVGVYGTHVGHEHGVIILSLEQLSASK